ncbi:YihY family inner membrane protein [Massilia sp. 9096]|uniref:YihY family inner membrane protein n=1 Tax=Massilia sp. 9096 TaxID=1500894 RepID=UPI000A4EF028
MLPKSVTEFSRSTSEMINVSVDMMRGLTWGETRDLVRFARRRLREEKLPQVAGSLTFTTTLALVPLLTIVLAIFTTFPIFGQLRTALDHYFVQMVMPRAIANTITSNLTQFASKATKLSALGAIALVFTSAAMIGTIERAFNQIWRVRQARPLLQRVLVYWALVTLGPLAFGISLTLTSQLFTATNGLTEAVPFVGALFYTAVSVALTTAAYALLYMTVPNRYVDWHDALWGGLVAAIAFEIAKRVFAVFIRQFPTYAIIYGALAALPLFLLWMYLSWLITLVGALLTAALPVVKYERWWYEPVPGGAFVDAVAVLKVLHGSATLTGTTLVSSAQIRAHTRIGYDEMTELLQRMTAAGWVGRVQHDAGAQSLFPWGAREGLDCWVLLLDPGQIRLADVYRLFVFGGFAPDAGGMGAEPLVSPLALDTGTLARQVECAVEDGLQVTLAEHFAPQAVAGRPLPA